MGDGKREKDIMVENNVEIIISFPEERTNVTENKWAAFVFILKVNNGKIMTERENYPLCIYVPLYILSASRFLHWYMPGMEEQ